MSEIPLARLYLRVAMLTLKDTWEGALVGEAERLMHREPPIMKTRVKNRHLSDELIEEIIAYHWNHPTQSQQELASIFGVNSGRVSEALNRKIVIL